MSVRVYVAQSMTGRPARDVLADSRRAMAAFWQHGLTPLDPAIAEGIQEAHGTLEPTKKDLAVNWARDKEMIQSAHVVLDLTGPRKSEGVAHEIGLARYFYWKPVVRVWPGLGASIARFEDDVVVETVEEAAQAIKMLWGTWYRRLWWRVRLYGRCRLRAFYMEFLEWINVLS